MKNFTDWLNESTSAADDKIKAEMIKHINEEIAKLKAKNAKAIASASNIIDINAVIEKCRVNLINSIPTVIAGLKSGKGAEQFAANFVSFTNAAIKQELDKAGFFSRNAARLLAPDKAEYLSRAKSFDATPFADALESCLDLAFAIGWMDAAKPYETTLFQWSNGISNWIDRNVDKVKLDLANTFSNFLYA